MKGCLISIAIIFILVVGGGLFVWINRDTIVPGVQKIFEVPSYGKKEYIDGRYGDLLRSLDSAAKNGFSVMTFGAAVEKMTLPPEVLYVGIVKGEDKTDVIKRFDWNGSGAMMIAGYGAGTLSRGGVTRKIMIYENSGPWKYMDKFVVYIEYSGDTKSLPSGPVSSSTQD